MQHRKQKLICELFTLSESTVQLFSHVNSNNSFVTLKQSMLARFCVLLKNIT